MLSLASYWFHNKLSNVSKAVRTPKTQLYSLILINFVDPRDRIVNGYVVEYGDIPWQVYISIYDNGRSSYCGGVLISKEHVLTAAHCLKSNRAENYVIRLGEHDLSGRDSGEVEGRVVKIIQHPLFSQGKTTTKELIDCWIIITIVN